jgi:hypothetical protein
MLSLDATVVGQFDDTSLGLLLAIGVLLLTALSGLGLSLLLWFRNRAGRRGRRHSR